MTSEIRRVFVIRDMTRIVLNAPLNPNQPTFAVSMRADRSSDNGLVLLSCLRHIVVNLLHL